LLDFLRPVLRLLLVLATVLFAGFLEAGLEAVGTG
jgi:hypothetical protein